MDETQEVGLDWIGVIKKEGEREQEAKREGGGESQKSKRGVFKLEEVEIKREEAGIGTDAGPIYNRIGKVGK